MPKKASKPIRHSPFGASSSCIAALAPLAVALFCLLLPCPASGAELRVPEDFKGVQEAIDAASTNDTVIVGTGVYTENITIKKVLALKSSSGAERTVLRPKDPKLPIVSYMGVAGGSLKGFTLTGSEDSGLALRDSREVEITANIARENAHGISLYSSHGNTLRDNSCDRNATYGIYLEKSTGNRIERNTASYNDDKGVFVSLSDRNEFIGNSANLNTWNGMLFFESRGNVIRGNTTLRNMYGLTVNESDGNTDEDNTSLPNIFLILPILLVYLGIMSYIVQKNILKRVYKT